MDWADDNGMTSIPVLDDHLTEVWPYFEYDWGIPTFVVLAPDMSVLYADQGVSDPGAFLP